MKHTELLDEFAKLKFHVRQLGSAIDYQENPIPALVVEMDWSEADLEAANDIFEAARAALDKGGTPSFPEFEKKLKVRFGISYQGIKRIVLAFYRNSQWGDVCEWYVKAHAPCPPREFHEIVKALADRVPRKSRRPGAGKSSGKP